MTTIEKQRAYPAYRVLLIQAAYFLCGLLVPQGVVFGSYAPFGVALAAAVPYSGALSASAGAAIGYILLMRGDSFRCVASVITVFALRWLFSDLPKINRRRIFAPLAAAAPLLCTGIVMILATGRGARELLMCVLEALLASVGAYFLSETANLAAGRLGACTLDQQEIACLVMSGCIFLLSVNTLTVGKISLGRIFASAAVLFCAYYGSVAGGCIGGTAAGVVFGLGSGDFTFLALSYSFGGLMAGMFSYVGKIGCAAAFLLCSTVAALSGGVTVQSAAAFYETATAAIIFLLIPHAAANRAANILSPRSSDREADALRRGVIARLDITARAIDSINDAVANVAKRLGEYYSSEMDTVFVSAIDETCTRCGMRAFCTKEGEDEHRHRLSVLAPVLKNTGSVDGDDVKRIFSKRCCRADELAESVNYNYGGYLSFLAAQARVSQVRGVVAGQFSGLSEILKGIKGEFEKYECSDTAAAEKITAALKVRGFLVYDCSVRLDPYGRMTVEAVLSSENARLLRRLDITPEISSLCGRKMQPPEMTSAGTRLRVTFCEKPRFDIQTGAAQHNCRGGKFCGDSFNYFRDGQGRFIVMISDGMGTGGRAAVDGGMTISVMTKLVKSGLGFDAALGAANSALMVKSDDESLATADILSINLFTGESEVMKAGAPVTFIRKSGKVIRIEPSSLPAGILPDVRLTHDEMTLGDGDIVVMLSDGAIAISDDWIGAMVRDFEGDDIHELVNDIIDEATIGSSLGRDDDITVVGMRVLENV